MTDFRLDPLALASELVRIHSVNPPGNEAACALTLAEPLTGAGFRIREHHLSPERPNLIAELPGSEPDLPPLALTGHLDVVPPGDAVWSFDPFCGEIREDRLLGRGSSDMKSGLAAMTSAAVELAATNPRRGLSLYFTVDEERGCGGSRAMAEGGYPFPGAGALIVAEPTGCRLGLGHKGALWLTVEARGKSAHGSMPEEGENAIYKLARAALALSEFRFDFPDHNLLGRPTINVGTISGGTATNLVPDQARMTVDIRMLPGQTVEAAAAEAVRAMDGLAEVVQTSGAAGVWTRADDPFVELVAEITARVTGASAEPRGLPYFTDAAHLTPALGNPPTVILGPGLAEQAHQTDEYCPVEQITQATEIYRLIGLEWLAS